MKVWLLHDFVNGGVTVYSEDTDIKSIPFVRIELGYLEGTFEYEREEFLDDLFLAAAKGRGEASIEERLRVELVDVHGKEKIVGF